MWHRRAKASKRPDGVLSKVGATGGQWVWGGSAEVRSDAATDHGRGKFPNKIDKS